MYITLLFVKLIKLVIISIRIYKDIPLKKFNIEVISPEEKDREEVIKVIYAIKAGNLSEEIGKNIFKIAQKLIDKGAEAIITGCTEIPLILKEGDISVPLIDSTQILARVTIQRAR